MTDAETGPIPDPWIEAMCCQVEAALRRRANMWRDDVRDEEVRKHRLKTWMTDHDQR